MNSLIKQIQYEYNKYYQLRSQKPNCLLLSTLGRLQLQVENKYMISFFDATELKSGSHMFGAEVLIVDPRDLDENMFKWIYVKGRLIKWIS